MWRSDLSEAGGTGKYAGRAGEAVRPLSAKRVLLSGAAQKRGHSFFLFDLPSDATVEVGP